MTEVNVLAGYNGNEEPKNADATIGSISVLGDLTATNIIAGIKDVNGDGFGNTDDEAIKANTTKLSTIGIIRVLGFVGSTPESADHFGIEAEFIRALDFGVTTVVLKPGPHNDADLLGPNGDVLLQEV